jgi:hypothetical protein
VSATGEPVERSEWTPYSSSDPGNGFSIGTLAQRSKGAHDGEQTSAHRGEEQKEFDQLQSSQMDRNILDGQQLWQSPGGPLVQAPAAPIRSAAQPREKGPRL